jgi:hypothetical protein
MSETQLQSISEQLHHIEAQIALLVRRQTAKEWYATNEVAQLLGRAEFTVREWCRLGRIHAEKKGNGRGKFKSWVVSHAEVQRIEREGLLPAQKTLA